MDPKTRVIAVGGSIMVLLVVIELVRRRKLKEEYSVLWILTGVVLLVLSIWYGLLLKITTLIGAVLPTSTLFFCGLIFVMLMLLHFSVRVSHLERRMTSLVQEIGLLSAQRDGVRPGPHVEETPLEDDAEEAAVVEQPLRR
jgi:hypothetical protein